MRPILSYLSERQKGFLLMGIGFLLLLHSLGILVGNITTLIIILSVGMIIYGLVMTGYHKILFEGNDKRS